MSAVPQQYWDPVIITTDMTWSEHHVWVKTHRNHRNHTLRIASFSELDAAEDYVMMLIRRTENDG